MSNSIITPQERVTQALAHLSEIRALFGNVGNVDCNVHGASLDDLAGVDGRIQVFPANGTNGPFITLDVHGDGCSVSLFSHAMQEVRCDPDIADTILANVEQSVGWAT